MYVYFTVKVEAPTIEAARAMAGEQAREHYGSGVFTLRSIRSTPCYKRAFLDAAGEAITGYTYVFHYHGEVA